MSAGSGGMRDAAAGSSAHSDLGPAYVQRGPGAEDAPECRIKYGCGVRQGRKGSGEIVWKDRVIGCGYNNGS